MTTKKKEDAPSAVKSGAVSTSTEVTLLLPHTHEGVRYQKDARITVRKRQVKQLQEWGVVK